MVQYKQNNKFEASTRIAVVVQSMFQIIFALFLTELEMVESVVSGVVFTIHPVTMDNSFFVVNAAPGLGEELVSGHINPDTIICDKATSIYHLHGVYVLMFVLGEVVTHKSIGPEPCLSGSPLSQLLNLSNQILEIFDQHGQGTNMCLFHALSNSQ